jgi:hypothetical protein
LLNRTAVALCRASTACKPFRRHGLSDHDLEELVETVFSLWLSHWNISFSLAFKRRLD